VYDIYDLFILLYYRGPKMPKNVAIYFFYTRYVYDYSPALCADMITVKKIKENGRSYRPPPCLIYLELKREKNH
jgi:hypothetical protein